MVLSVTHAFVSAIADDAGSAAAGEVLPSHWNAGHTVTGDLPVSQLNGGSGASALTFWRGDGIWAAAGGSSSPTVYDVTTYGAVGDGTTDDTAAINAAIAAFNTATKGVLYFPAGTYKCTAALTTVTANGLITGDGTTNASEQIIGTVTDATTITCTSTTASLFTIHSQSLQMSNLSLKNTAVGSVTAGAGVTVTHATEFTNKVDFNRVTVQNFYINIDVQAGANWVISDVFCVNPVLYGVKIRNINNPDAGDWCIDQSHFYTDTQSGDAAIRIESSGGGKISNIKVNCNNPPTQFFDYGIDLAGAGNTVDLLITNCSIENFSNTGIKVNGSWPNIILNGIQFGAYATTAVTAISLASTSGVTVDNIVIAGTYSSNPVVISSVTETTIGSVVNADAVYSGNLLSALPTTSHTSSGQFGSVLGNGHGVEVQACASTSNNSGSFRVTTPGVAQITVNSGSTSFNSDVGFAQGSVRQWAMDCDTTQQMRLFRDGSENAAIFTFGPSLADTATLANRRLVLNPPWNNGATTFTGLTVEPSNIGGYANGSKLFDCRFHGNSLFSMKVHASFTAGTITGTPGAGVLEILDVSGNMFFQTWGGGSGIANQISLSSAANIGFNPNTSVSGANDCGFKRVAAKTIELYDGATSATEGYLRLSGVGVGSLPAASATYKGCRGTVTDSNATLTAGIGAVVAAGGANVVPVFCDGTNWRIG